MIDRDKVVEFQEFGAICKVLIKFTIIVVNFVCTLSFESIWDW